MTESEVKNESAKVNGEEETKTADKDQQAAAETGAGDSPASPPPNVTFQLKQETLICETRILCEDIINNLDGVDDSMMVDEGILSDSEVMQSVFDKNHNLRRMQLIVDWLEQNEQDKDDQNSVGKELAQKLGFYWLTAVLDGSLRVQFSAK